MNGDFIKKFAEIRAEQIFTPDYFTKVTDSWYFDEKFRFENLKVGKEQRYPNKKESDIYMGYLSDLFDKYRDKYYGEALAQDCYSKCIDCFDRLLQYIEYGKKCRWNQILNLAVVQVLKEFFEL